jgi:hypothetical protein
MRLVYGLSMGLVAWMGALALADPPVRMNVSWSPATNPANEASQVDFQVKNGPVIVAPGGERGEYEGITVLAGPSANGRARSTSGLETIYIGRPAQRMEKAAYLGITVSPVTAVLCEQLKLQKGLGVVVDFVEKGSPAEAAGVRQYDILQKLNDQLLIDAYQLAILVRTFKPGDEIKLTVLHQGQPQTLSARLVEKEVAALDENNPWGMPPMPWAHQEGVEPITVTMANLPQQNAPPSQWIAKPSALNVRSNNNVNSDSARVDSLLVLLQTIRSQIELYALQHKDAQPDLVANQWNQLLKKTDAAGAVDAAEGATYGPYLLSAPQNPLNGFSIVAAAPGPNVGWVYDASKHTIQATNRTPTLIFDQTSRKVQ